MQQRLQLLSHSPEMCHLSLAARSARFPIGEGSLQ